MTNTKLRKPYAIHFVCRGNTYRSRLAAAYMATLLDDRFAVSSSGIAAAYNPTKTSEVYTKATARKHKLTQGISAYKTQTTDLLLADADVIIFMNKDVYEDARRDYTFDLRKCKVWHVADMGATQKQASLAMHTEQALVDAAAATFRHIARECDALAEYLTHTAWVDVVSKDNQMTGLRLPLGWVTDRGLWHRGVHVVVRTHDGRYVVGKRVSNIVFAPGMLEISLGGGIDSGERAIQAARREMHEELGVLMPEYAFTPLFMYRKSSYHPHYRKYTRGHVYVYSVTLPAGVQLHAQPEEVAELRTLSPRQIRRLLRSHRLRHFGRLTWGYKLAGKAVAYSSLLP
jgi:8-oxo-dGTP pyrophosphatase MutT (NUDIX family)/protein-tyrosine-phosphatase